MGLKRSLFLLAVEKGRRIEALEHWNRKNPLGPTPLPTHHRWPFCRRHSAVCSLRWRTRTAQCRWWCGQCQPVAARYQMQEPCMQQAGGYPYTYIYMRRIPILCSAAAGRTHTATLTSASCCIQVYSEGYAYTHTYIRPLPQQAGFL